LYRERGIPLTLNQIALTASTSEAYALLFKLLCDPDGEILVPVPSYPLFEHLAALEDVRTIPYRLMYDGTWFIDFADFRSRLSTRSRAVVVVNPNNPTGSFLKPSEREQLLTLASDRGIPVICDEVFMDYPFVEQAGPVSTLAGQDTMLVFALNGLSKMAAMPQMKLGWIVIGGPNKDREEARIRLELLLDTYLSVSTPVQEALGELLKIGAENRRVLKSRIAENLRTLAAVLSDQPVHALNADGGWAAILQLPNTQSEDRWVTKLLEEENTIVQPGYFFDMPSEPYIVLSLITPEKIFAEGISRIVRLANRS
jgi:aspartate/methionine/tyrosine aminotransferase